MIGKVSGLVDYKADDHVLIDTGGVGYTVYCAPATLGALPGPGEAAALYTDLVVREDLLQLFGFRTLAERECHRLLVSVQGVGAKVSLAILGSLGVSGITRALAAGDANAVRAAPGVGPKLAARIVSELKGKAPEMMTVGGRGTQAATPTSAPTGATPVPQPSDLIDDGDSDAEAAAAALSALVNLGYDRVEAAAAVAEAGPGDETTLIKAALRTLDRKG
ncbi:MAG: Holliday junction branch migration protein RuvA [Pseudomonadota bacterium]